MKKSTLLLLPLFVVLSFYACEKGKDLESKKDWGEKEDWKDDDIELCQWDEATEASGDTFEKYTVEELVYSEDCGCYISGFEKFLENGQTRFLIYYKTDDCVGYGYKVTCENGDCESEGTQKCKFLQECEGN